MRGVLRDGSSWSGLRKATIPLYTWMLVTATRSPTKAIIMAVYFPPLEGEAAALRAAYYARACQVQAVVRRHY